MGYVRSYNFSLSKHRGSYGDVMCRASRLTCTAPQGNTRLTYTVERLLPMPGFIERLLLALYKSNVFARDQLSLGHSYEAPVHPQPSDSVNLEEPSIFIMSQIPKAFGALPPNVRVTPEEFVVAFPQTELDDLRSLIAASRVGPETFEGLQQDRKYGVTTQWLRDAKISWLEEFNWYVLSPFITTCANT